MRADDLAALVAGEIVKRTELDPAKIEEVVVGCADQAGADNRNLARMAVWLAGLPIEMAGQTINRLCGSGLNAINAAANAIKTGEGDVFIAGRVESMTRAPFDMLKSAMPFAREVSVADTTIGWRFVDPRMAE